MPSERCPQCAEPVNRGDRGDRFCEECGARVADQHRDRVEVDLGVAGGISDRGRRPRRNEDALALRGVEQAADGGTAVVAIVCDGVSTSARPDEASDAAARTAAEALVVALGADGDPAVATREAICAAGRAVADLAGDEDEPDTRSAPACTFVSAVSTGNKVTVGWVGDSRAYWIPRAGTGSPPPSRMTEDDSWLAQVLAAGTMTLADATADRRAHAITAWLGRDAAPLDPHVITIAPDGPGVMVVCSDGLWNYLDGVGELAAALPADASQAPLNAARELVEVALHAGGHDNITVVVLPFIADRAFIADRGAIS